METQEIMKREIVKSLWKKFMEQENEIQLAEFQLIIKSYQDQEMGLGEQELEVLSAE